MKVALFAALAAILGAREGSGRIDAPVYALPSIQERDARFEALVRHNDQVKRVRDIIRRHAPKGAKTKGLATLIVRESAKVGADPLYVAAIVKSESTFRLAARSNRNAQGLMQVTPITEREMTLKDEECRARSKTLSDPEYNLRIGIRYMRRLEDKYRGNRLLALVAYNWGPGHLVKALKGKRSIPQESLHYASRILENHHRWSAQG